MDDEGLKNVKFFLGFPLHDKGGNRLAISREKFYVKIIIVRTFKGADGTNLFRLQPTMLDALNPVYVLSA